MLVFLVYMLLNPNSFCIQQKKKKKEDQTHCSNKFGVELIHK